MRIRCGHGRGREGAPTDVGAIHEHIHREGLCDFATRLHERQQAVDGHRRLLGAGPVAGRAVQHHPTHRAFNQRILGVALRQRLHGERGGFDAGLGGIEQQRVVRDRPPRYVATRLRLSDQRLCQFVATRVFRLVHQQQQQRPAVRAHATTRIPRVVTSGRVRVLVLRAFGEPGDLWFVAGGALQDIGFVDLQVRLDPRVGRIQLRQRAGAVVDAILLHLHPGTTRLIQAPQCIGGHERMVAVRLPPSPPAIVMLIVIQTLQAGRYLAIECR